MKEKDSELLHRAYKYACQKLENYTETGVAYKDIESMRMAMGVIATYSRLKGIELQERQFEFLKAEKLSSSKQELRQLVSENENINQNS
jgi:hypothetical protein